MQIQWFPGHMNKTKHLIQENLGKVDVIIEILDSRVPVSSSNPMITELIGDKPRLVVLNKSDLSDPEVTTRWMEYYRGLDKTLPVQVSSKTFDNLDSISKTCRELCQDAKWIDRREVRGMVVGIPNVGKSTIINALSGKKKAAVGNKPGLTRGLQRINITNSLQIYDTPGILWPKFEDKTVGYNLAAVGSIKDTILDLVDIARESLDYFIKRYPNRIKERYNIEGELSQDSYELLNLIGKKRGCLQAKGVIDLDRAVAFFLKDLRDGKLGLISLEEPEDMEERLIAAAEAKAIRDEKLRLKELRKSGKRKNR
ncbi:MAG: ribosome biogenesis GTPase YlqF [Spirochaetaceae bacterium 4572_7]|nr:MAG: ribosome biogenesis GTPase YlqF [Spirochaetaceae bacterium 4572_7]